MKYGITMTIAPAARQVSWSGQETPSGALVSTASKGVTVARSYQKWSVILRVVYMSQAQDGVLRQGCAIHCFSNHAHNLRGQSKKNSQVAGKRNLFCGNMSYSSLDCIGQLPTTRLLTGLVTSWARATEEWFQPC